LHVTLSAKDIIEQGKWKH